jgi:hypothetical protein
MALQHLQVERTSTRGLYDAGVMTGTGQHEDIPADGRTRGKGKGRGVRYRSLNERCIRL